MAFVVCWNTVEAAKRVAEITDSVTPGHPVSDCIISKLIKHWYSLCHNLNFHNNSVARSKSFSSCSQTRSVSWLL